MLQKLRDNNKGFPPIQRASIYIKGVISSNKQMGDGRGQNPSRQVLNWLKLQQAGGDPWAVRTRPYHKPCKLEMLGRSLAR